MKKEHIVGHRLREYRGNRTQAEMAALLNVTPNYYGEMERGNKLPSFDMLLNFIVKTGKDANYWFGIETPSTSARESSPSPTSNLSLSIDRMSLDTLSAFFRDRVKREVDVVRDSTFDRVSEDITELYILLHHTRKKERGYIA